MVPLRVPIPSPQYFTEEKRRGDKTKKPSNKRLIKRRLRKPTDECQTSQASTSLLSPVYSINPTTQTLLPLLPTDHPFSPRERRLQREEPMKPNNRRLANDNLQPKPPPSPGPASSTDPTDAAAVATQFDSSSMAVTALVLISALFFLGFFSIYARRFFSERRGGGGGGGDSSADYLSRPSPSMPYARLFYGSGGAARGLEPSAVRALPLSRYRGEGGAKEGARWCVVCLNEFEEKETVKVIPGCGHVFHPRCIDAWLVARGSCPLCRCSQMAGWRSSSGDREEACLEVVVSGDGEDSDEGDHDGVGGGGGEEGFGLGVETESGRAEAVEGKVVGLGRSSSWSWRDEQGRMVFLRRTCSF